MLFHLVPKVFNPYSNITNVEIQSITIPEYNIKIGLDELNQGRPMPNKNYVIGMLKNGRKAVNGLFISLPDDGVKTFNVEILWKMMVNDKDVFLTHKIINHIDGEITKECDFITQDATFCYGYKNFESNWSKHHESQSPMEIAPVLHLEKNGVNDQVGEIYMPVLERDRIYTDFSRKIPEKIWVKLN